MLRAPSRISNLRDQMMWYQYTCNMTCHHMSLYDMSFKV